MSGEQITDGRPDGTAIAAVRGRLRVICQLPFSGFPVVCGYSELRVCDVQDFVIGVCGIGLSGDEKDFADSEWFDGGCLWSLTLLLQANFKAIPAAGRDCDGAVQGVCRLVGLRVLVGVGLKFESLPRQI